MNTDWIQVGAKAVEVRRTWSRTRADLVTIETVGKQFLTTSTGTKFNMRRGSFGGGGVQEAGQSHSAASLMPPDNPDAIRLLTQSRIDSAAQVTRTCVDHWFRAKDPGLAEARAVKDAADHLVSLLGGS